MAFKVGSSSKGKAKQDTSSEDDGSWDDDDDEKMTLCQEIWKVYDEERISC